MKQDDVKGISIRTSGLLQSIINSGASVEKWEELLQHALGLHHKYVHKLIKMKEQTCPERK